MLVVALVEWRRKSPNTKIYCLGGPPNQEKPDEATSCTNYLASVFIQHKRPCEFCTAAIGLTSALEKRSFLFSEAGSPKNTASHPREATTIACSA